MKNFKYLFGVLSICIVLFNISCKKSITNSVVEKVRIDTIRDYKVITKYDAVHDTLVIDNPCDSSGILTRFYAKVSVPQGKVIIRSYKGKIQAVVDIDSIASVYENKYKNSAIQNTSKEVVVKNEIPRLLIWILIVTSVLSALYVRDKISIFVK